MKAMYRASPGMMSASQAPISEPTNTAGPMTWNSRHSTAPLRWWV